MLTPVCSLRFEEITEDSIARGETTISNPCLSLGIWVPLVCWANQKQGPIYSTPLPYQRGQKAVLFFKGLLNKEECQRQEAERPQWHLCMPADMEKNLWMIQRSPSEGQDLSLPWPEWDPLHAHWQRRFKGSLGECVCAYNCDCGLCKQRWDDARKLSWFLPSGEHLTQTIWQALHFYC